MKKKLIFTALGILTTGFAVTGCSREFAKVEESVTSTNELSIAEVTTTESETTTPAASTAEPEAIVITVAPEAADAETTQKSDIESGGENSGQPEDGSIALEDDQAIISYQSGECIIIRIPSGYYEYNTDMTNYVTLMSDKTDDFYTIADYADTITPSVVQENMEAEQLSENSFIKMNDKGCDYYYFSESGHAVKITYTTYGTDYTEGYINGIKSGTYLMEMAQSFIFQP